MDSKPCTCHGDNSNCFKCFGTGMISDKNVALEKTAIARSRVPSFTIASSQPLRQPSLTAIPKCAICGVIVPKRMERHYKKCHAGFNLTKFKTIPVFECSTCGIIASSQLILDVHKNRVHGINDDKIRNQQGSSVIDRRIFANESNAWNLKDATKDWGSAFRDHGQFGSHASYDAMDDESNA